jgi:monoamine oxidase
MQTHVVIIGAGLSGLYSAYLLKQKGIKTMVIEARDRVGGRVVSMPLSDDEQSKYQRYDLGPSWFWPEMHPAMAQLVEHFDLQAFPQYQSGAHVFDRGRNSPPQRYDLGMTSSPQSMRLVGGMQSLIEALSQSLDPETVRLNTTVSHINYSYETNISLALESETNQTETLQASHVILAMPPRLIASSIDFSPALPKQVKQHFANTMTWMAAHAKLVAVYADAFWRDDGLSGSASSQTGPLIEVHDASAMEGKAALFGFVGVNAAARKTAGREALIKASIAQLAHIFGEKAASPLEVFLVDWSDENLTATEQDHIGAANHPVYGLPSSAQGLWNGKLLFAGTEAANTDGGYLEGALNAAKTATNSIEL